MAEPQRVIVEKRGGCGSGCALFLLIAIPIYGIVEGAKWLWAHPFALGGLIVLLVVLFVIWVARAPEEAEAPVEATTEGPAIAPPPAAAAGWYADPRGEKRFRYWDAERWTDAATDEPPR